MNVEAIRDALRIPFDMLCQMDIVYHLQNKKPNIFKEQENYETQNIAVKGLIVEKRKNTQVNETLQGSYTYNEGYLLLSYDVCLQVGLVDNQGNFAGNPNTDTFSYQGKKYKILDIEPTGQLVNKFTCFKIYYKTFEK